MILATTLAAALTVQSAPTMTPEQMLDSVSLCVAAGMGSAIFLHLARPGFTPTEGCIALSLEDMLEVMRLAGPGSAIEITL